MGILKKIGFASSLFLIRMFDVPIPLIAPLGVTTRCNLRCEYCFGRYGERTGVDFSTDELIEIVNGLKNLGTKFISLTGGEPLIRSDIGTLVKAVRDAGIICGMNTNGILIPQRKAEIKYLDSITISLDGPKEMHDLNRGRDSFEKTMAGVEAAVDLGLDVRLDTVLTRHNVDGIDWLVEFARKRRILLEFNFLYHQGPQGNPHQLNFDPSWLRKAALRLVAWKRQGAPIFFSERAYKLASRWPEPEKKVFLNREPPPGHPVCKAGKNIIFIEPNGEVYPCPQTLDFFKPLNLRAVGLKKAWEHCWKHSCKACYFPCLNEFNDLLNLRFRSIFNQFTHALRRKTGKIPLAEEREK